MPIPAEVLTALNTTQDALIKNLIDDTRSVYSTMLGFDLMHLPLEVDPMEHFQDCVSAMVGLAGTYNGLISIHQPVSLGIKLAEAMLDMELSEVDQDVMDALGEIANMVAGNVKQHLSKGGMDIRLSTPSVATGKDYIICAKQANSMNLLFDLDEEWILVSIVLEID
ncbi:MAG: chemotaxis protein CheX [Geobacter sp.]|nr:chemotaxis protein CheX [Geobacter sp.]